MSPLHCWESLWKARGGLWTNLSDAEWSATTVAVCLKRLSLTMGWGLYCKSLHTGEQFTNVTSRKRCVGPGLEATCSSSALLCLLCVAAFGVHDDFDTLS